MCVYMWKLWNQYLVKVVISGSRGDRIYDKLAVRFAMICFFRLCKHTTFKNLSVV